MKITEKSFYFSELGQYILTYLKLKKEGGTYFHSTYFHSKMHYLKSLIYFEDAELDPMPKMLKSRSWNKIKEGITKEVMQMIK